MRLEGQRAIVTGGGAGIGEAIVKAAVYLASADAAFVTGTCFVIDGGLTMQ